MTLSPVGSGVTAKAFVDQRGTSPLSTVTTGLTGAYATGEIVRCWVRHRSTVTTFTGAGTGWYLCDTADANRLQLTLGPLSQADQAGDLVQFGFVVVPSGATYTTIKCHLVGGSTANWLDTKAFTSTTVLQTRNVNGDYRPAPIAGSQNKQVSLDISAPVTGGGCLCCAAVATNTVTNSSTATNGYVVSAQPSAPRGVVADKALASAPSPGGAAATVLAWAAGAQESALLVTLQETAATAFVGIGAHIFSHMNFAVTPTVVSTTIGIDTGFAMVFQPDFHVNIKNTNGNPTLVTYIPTVTATRTSSAPPIAQINNNITVFSTPPATRRASAPAISLVDLLATTLATRKATAPAITVTDFITTSPATRTASAPLIELILNETPANTRYRSGPTSTHVKSAPVSVHYESGAVDAE